MTRTVKVSLKIKIIISIVILLALSLISTLKFSIDIFEEDKRSYIYENALNINEQVSSEINELINKSVKEAALINQLSRLSKNISKTQINSSDILIAMKTKRNTYKNYTFFKKYNLKSDSIFKWKLPSPALINSEAGPILLYKSDSNTLLVDFSSVIALTKRYSSFDISVFKGNTRIYDPKEAQNIDLLNKIDSTTINKGTKEVSIKGSDYLYSYHLDDKLFNIIVSIPKEKAFIATSVLKTKSLYFGLTLLFLFIVLGTFFGITLTKPINKLLQGTKNVADGVYNQEIKVNSSDEFGVLAGSFNFMSSEINQLITTLEDYNKNLENMVEQRTKELSEANEFIKAMVNSLDQGLLVFDKEGNCNDIYTKACEKIFEKTPQDLTFDQVLDLNEKETKNFKSWNDVLFQDLLPFESSIGLGPQNYIKGESIEDPNYKHVSLNYYPIRDDKKALANVVSVATDITKEVKSQKAFDEKASYVSMVLKIINNKTQFFSFIKEVNATLENIHEAIKQEDLNIDYILMNWHSLNGGMGIFNVLNLQVMARNNETKLVEVKSNLPENIKTVLLNQLEDFQVSLHEFLLSTKDIFGKSWEEEQTNLILTGEQVTRLEDLINDSNNDSLKEFYEEQFVKVPIEEFFNGYIELVESSAKNVNKKIEPLRIEGGQLRIGASEHEELFSVMVHLFRNCVDHGIEAPAKRVEQSKPESGKIEVEFQKIQSKGKSWLNITVKDDGAGIDPQKIRSKLSEMYPDENFDSIADDQIIYKIFDPSFTTTTEVSALSGRGVGMSAIKDVIDKKKGSLKITSTVGKGSEFVFSVPE